MTQTINEIDLLNDLDIMPGCHKCTNDADYFIYLRGHRECESRLICDSCLQVILKKEKGYYMWNCEICWVDVAFGQWLDVTEVVSI